MTINFNEAERSALQSCPELMLFLRSSTEALAWLAAWNNVEHVGALVDGKGEMAVRHLDRSIAWRAEAIKANGGVATHFSRGERKALAESPTALRELAEWHSVQETMADASDCREAADHHEKRRIELTIEADRLQAEQDAAI